MGLKEIKEKIIKDFKSKITNWKLPKLKHDRTLKIKVIAVLSSIIIVLSITLISIHFAEKAKKEVKHQKTKQIAIEKYRQSPKYLAKMQKQLGPDWKLIKLSEQRWYGPLKTKGGSEWKVYSGEVWVKIGNARAFLDKPGQENNIGLGNYMFYPKTSFAIVFYKY